MAKKRSSPRNSGTAVVVAETPTNKQLDDKGREEKMENLKTLNRMLLKEAMEDREQLAQLRAHLDSVSADSSILQTLERDVSRILISDYNSDAVEKNREMSSKVSSFSGQLSDFVRSARKVSEEKEELEKKLKAVIDEKDGVVRVVEVRDWKIEELDSKIREMVMENNRVLECLEKVSEEKEELEKKLKSVVDEKDGVVRIADVKDRTIEELESKVREVVMEKDCALESLEKVREECLRLGELEEERKEFMRSIIREKKLLNSRILEYEQSVKQMEKEMEELLRMNEAEISSMEAERNNHAERIVSLEGELAKFKGVNDQLEKELSGAQEMIEMFKGKEEELQLEIVASGKKNAEFEEEIERLRADYGIMEKEMKDKEMAFEGKDRESMKRIDELSKKMKEILGEKDAVEQQKAMQEVLMRGLENEVDNLQFTVSNLKDSAERKDQYIASLQSCIDSAQRTLSKEMEEGGKLGAQLEKAVKRKDQLEQELHNIRAKLDRLESEHEIAEKQSQQLKKEKAYLEESLSAAQCDCEDMKVKVGLASLNSARSLSLLKSTMEAIKSSFEGRENSEAREIVNELSEEIRPFALELDGIKMAFTSKAKKTEELSREVEFLRTALAEEQKSRKKGLWTWVCPATTAIFAAISFAYATRAH